MTFLEYLSILRRRWIYLAVGLLAGAVGGFLTAPGRHRAARGVHRHPHAAGRRRARQSGANLNLQQSALLADTGPGPGAAWRSELADVGLPAPLNVERRGRPRPPVPGRHGHRRPTGRRRSEAADLTAEAINDELTAHRPGRLRRPAQRRATSRSTRSRASWRPRRPARRRWPPRTPLAQPCSPSSGQRSRRRWSSLRTQVQDLESQGAPDPPLTTLEAAKARAGRRAGRCPRAARRAPRCSACSASLLGPVRRAGRRPARHPGAGQGGRRAGLRPAGDRRDPADGQRVGAGPRAARGHQARLPVRRGLPRAAHRRAVRRRRAAPARTDGAANGSDADGSRTQRRRRPTGPRWCSSPRRRPARARPRRPPTSPAVLAEAGRRTLVISADFRRPRIHEYFGVPREPGPVRRARVRHRPGPPVRPADGHHLRRACTCCPRAARSTTPPSSSPRAPP